MRFFKRVPSPFGKKIEANCLYCRYNTSEKIIVCPFKNEDGSVCKRYEYDPTMRKPKNMPKLKEYSEDDFLI